jgi:hypothetical protein
VVRRLQDCWHWEWRDPKDPRVCSQGNLPRSSGWAAAVERAAWDAAFAYDVPSTRIVIEVEAGE